MNSEVHSEEEDDGDIGDISSNSFVPSLHISNDDLDLMQFNFISKPLSEVFDTDWGWIKLAPILIGAGLDL